MKTTIDLPAELVKKLKLRAVHQRRKVKDVAAELLSSALEAPSQLANAEQFRIVKSEKTGLPVIESTRPHGPVHSLTRDEMEQILLDQEAQWAWDVAHDVSS
jgi:hypothetical protein